MSRPLVGALSLLRQYLWNGLGITAQVLRRAASIPSAVLSRFVARFWGNLKPRIATIIRYSPTAMFLLLASPFILAAYLAYLLVRVLASRAVAFWANQLWRAASIPVIQLGKLTAMAWGYTRSAVASFFRLAGKVFATAGGGLVAAVTTLQAATETLGRDLRAGVSLLSRSSWLAMVIGFRFTGRSLTIGLLNLAVAAGILVFSPLLLLRIAVDKTFRQGLTARATGLWGVFKARPAVGLLCLGGPILLSLAFLLISGLIWPSPSTVEVLIWTSAEKQSVLQPALERFNLGDPQLILDGRRYRVVAHSVTVDSRQMYGDLVARLSHGIDFPVSAGGAPTVVSPSTSGWLAQVNLDTGRPVFRMDSLRPVVRTPIVILTYRGMAECLGWPEQPVGWGDIIALAESPEGWAVCPKARTEWGVKPVIAFPDPSDDSAARSTLQILYLAAAGKPAEQLTVADVDGPRVRGLIRRFRGVVESSDAKVGELESAMDLGPGSVHFMPAEEYNISQHYRELTDAEPATGQETRFPPLDESEFEVVAIYPMEGTVWHDNPFAIPTAPWVTDEQREAARLVEEYLRGGDVQAQFMEYGFRPGIYVPQRDLLTPPRGLDLKQPRIALGRVAPEVAHAILRSWEDENQR